MGKSKKEQKAKHKPVMAAAPVKPVVEKAAAPAQPMEKAPKTK
ncbi:MAG TPA: hypothetical protein PLI88_02155 [Bacillota bacterium]|nr:hypothetical protein [Bacillota bacterium]HPI00934.1 hypothetical protein [Bacillota bacterium]